jgi:hypothetical protein
MRGWVAAAGCITMFALAPVAHGAPLPTGNLIQDPGAEQGGSAGLAHSSDPADYHPPPNPPWASTATPQQVAYGTPNFPTVAQSTAFGGGLGFFAGGPPDQNQQLTQDLVQDVHLDAYAEMLATGRVRAILNGQLGGFGSQTDNARVNVDFVDTGADNTFGTMSIGPVTATDRGNVTGLLSRSAVAAVPADTRRMTVDLHFTVAALQQYNDGYADNLSLVLKAVPLVHTTGADQISQGAARISGTVDDGTSATTWHVEYGTTTSYGSRTGDVATTGAGGAKAVQATLGGLTPGTLYHARIVADGPSGPVNGEDVAFTTVAPDVAAPGLPDPLDFTWTPRADVLVAGAPSGGVLFQASHGAGVTYAWDFDFHDGNGFQPDPSATGEAPRHGFTADGAHDTERVTGADGTRRRVYTVRLRATAANGASGEVTHEIVVMPNSPPKVDFTTRRADTTVSHPVTFTPVVTDPDQGPRTADHVDHIEWDFDPPSAGGQADLICDPDGSNCRTPDGSALGSWFTPGDGHQATVNFFGRALAAHGLTPLATVDLNTLPTERAPGQPLVGAIGVRSWSTLPYWIEHDPRLSYLYDNATLLQQSTFDLDAGEATGATLRGGATAVLRSARTAKAKAKAKVKVPYAQLFAGKYLAWREVTLTAVDSAGERASITHTVPLVPDQAPKLQAAFVNRDPNGLTNVIFRPSATKVRLPRTAHKAATSTQSIDYPLTTADELAFDASASSDPDGSIAYYTLEVGSPLQDAGICSPKGPPLTAGGNGPISVDPPEPGYGPGEFFPGSPLGGAGPAILAGNAGSLPLQGLNPKGLQKAGFRVAPSKLPPLETLLATKPLVHDCAPYVARNLVPGSFKVKQSPAVRPPVTHAGVNPNVLLTPAALLQPQHDLEYDTTAIVTRDPADLRFRIPNPGTYSVTVSAYDDQGLGATQRTDGFKIVPPSGTCQNIAGQPLFVGGRKLGFSGQCMDYGGKSQRFWTTHDIDVNGIGLRPDPGSAIFIALDGSGSLRLFATRDDQPKDFLADDPLATDEQKNLNDHPGGVSLVVDGEPVGHWSTFKADRVLSFLHNDPAAQAVIPSGATYHGSPLARPSADGPDFDSLSAVFESQGVGTSHTHFRIVLPAQFSREGAGTAPTADVDRPGVDEPRSTELTTNTFADIARHKTQHSGPTAHAALDLNGTLDISGTTIGPVSIQSGKLQFDTARGLWRGDIDQATIVLGPKIVGVKFHILIDHGALKELGGEVEDKSGGIPIFTGITLNAVRFSIVTDPLTMSGGATFKVVDLLTGDLDLTVRVDPVFLRLQGRIGLAGLELGGGFVQYDEANAKSLTFGGHFGFDFGPASLRAELQGGISFADPVQYYIQGSGHACVWICLDVQALASNIAVAACGSIDLFIGTISAGLAYRFGEGLDVFSGCDLDPYKPAVFRTRAGPSLPRALTVEKDTEEVAFRFFGDPTAPGAPKLTLTGPDGRVFSTATQPGDYAFAPPEPITPAGKAAGITQSATALIDQDPVDHISTVLVAKPAAGDWHVDLAPGQLPLAKVEQSVGRHVPDKELQASVATATVGSTKVTIGRSRFGVGGAHAAATRRVLPATTVRALRRLPQLERTRLRGVVLDVPTGLTGKLTLIDAGPHSSTVVRTIDMATTNGKVPVAFDPGGEPGPHELQAFMTHSDGVPRQSTVVDRFTAPPIPTPSAPKINVHRVGRRATVIDVDPGTAGSPTSAAASFDIVVVTSSGQRIERIVDGKDAVPLPGGRFRVTLGRLGGATVKVSARMRYGGTIGLTGNDILHRR